MKINRTGITRIVIELGEVVIKVPNFCYSFRHFLHGLLANIAEKTIWDIAPYCEVNNQHLLCPVKWCSWGGWILIMQKADMKAFEDRARKAKSVPDELFYKLWIDAGYGGDDKMDNYGILNGRPVKVDYGS